MNQAGLTNADPGQFVEHLYLVVARRQHPHLLKAVLFRVVPPGVDHRRLRCVLVAAEVEAARLLVVEHRGADFALTEPVELLTVDAEALG